MTPVIYKDREIDLDAARLLMDDFICDKLHGCGLGLAESPQNFFDLYLLLHYEAYEEEFCFS